MEKEMDICHNSMQHAALVFLTFSLFTGSVSYSLVFLTSYWSSDPPSLVLRNSFSFFPSYSSFLFSFYSSYSKLLVFRLCIIIFILQNSLIFNINGIIFANVIGAHLALWLRCKKSKKWRTKVGALDLSGCRGDLSSCYMVFLKQAI